MKTITFAGWRKNFDKVGLNRLLQIECGYGLAEAKAIVDAILAGAVVSVDFVIDEVPRIQTALAQLDVLFTVIESKCADHLPPLVPKQCASHFSDRRVKTMNLPAIFQKHCDDLGVEAICPYEIVHDGVPIQFIAWLPDFGGPKGMSIHSLDAPDMQISDAHRIGAEKAGLYCSFVNPVSMLDRRDFVEALQDWGYYGPEQMRPMCMQKSKDGS